MTLNLRLQFFTFLGSILLLFQSVIAQTPCVFPPAILSQDISNNSTTVICNGNPLTLSTTTTLIDCPTCTYAWSNGATGPFAFAFTPGLYSVTITDNASGGCVGVSTALNITASTLAEPLILGDSFNVCNGTIPAVLEVSNPCIGCTYQWYDMISSPGAIGGATSTTYSTLVADEYYVFVADGNGCTETSRVIIVGTATASVPPFSSTSSTVCNGNIATMSTINCSGCSYEWHFYDFPPDDKLMITGVFNGTRSGGGGGQPKGIELYANGNIPDLSLYSVETSFAGGAFSSPFVFPAVSVPSGTFIYIAEDATEFTNFFGFAPNYETAGGVANINGNDVIRISYNNVPVDIFGDVSQVSGPFDFSMLWAFDDGWAYRLDNKNPSTTFAIGDWDIFDDILDSCITNATSTVLCPAPSTCCTFFPLQSFSTNIAASSQQIIPGVDTAIYQTNTTGYYSIQVTYPNGCAIETTPLFLLDTSIFNPQITSQTPNLLAPSGFLTSNDTAYLCFNSYVNLYTQNPFLAPPTWSYQWYRNGVAITGATGYNYTATTAGLYSVEVVNSDGCISMSNIITIIASNNGANPSISATSLYLCSSTYASTLNTPGCIGCSYAWKTEDGLTPSGITNVNSYTAIDARGYYVIVTDNISGCSYSSNILEIKDTIYPAPILTTGGDVSCSSGPIILSTVQCAGCNYIWKVETTGTFQVHDSTQQFTEQISTAGKYRVEILYPNGCRTIFSNTIQATFQTVNAVIATPAITSICNGQSVGISALPDTANCVGCNYVFLRDGVAMQAIAKPDSQTISLAGDYQVVVTNADNCSDTSSIVTFQEVSISTDISQSAGKICGPTSSVVLEIDRCTGCDYQWYLGATALVSNQDTFLVATGYAAVGLYKVEVTKLGCLVSDSITLDSVPQRTIHITIDSVVNTSPTICNGASVFLLDTCQNCISQNLYQYQWFFNNDTILGASFESYQVDTPGLYYVKIVDGDNCRATSNQITVQEFTPPSNFALDFSPLGPAVPITYGTMDLDNYLTPSSLHTRGVYSSLTAGGALGGGLRKDILNVGAAGSGYHDIKFTYVDSNALGSCTFSTQDRLEVLGAMAMDAVNSNPAAPAFEACLFDTLTVSITNFTFIPTHVLFVAGGGNTISVPVTPSVTPFAGVYSGTFTVIVPDGARTGKLTLMDGTNSFESPNFFVVQNPAVTIDLLGTVQPVCSTLDTAVFSGLPAGGVFSAHYIGQATNPSLISTNNLLLNNINGYVSGVQNVMMLYTYTPTYTGTSTSCPQVKDSLLVEIRDSELDSVFYTPIAISQVSEAMDSLTLITYPVSARYYPKTYSGTYVVFNTLFPNTITSGPGNQSITYEINNGGCINSSEDSINIWPKPTILDAIPNYLCQREDTVFIRQNTDSLWVMYRGQLIYSDTLYKYSPYNGLIGTSLNPEVVYNGEINHLEVTSTNGGLNTINASQGDLNFHFIPANVVGGSTTLNFKFEYLRTSNYFDGSGGPPVTEDTRYTIAEVSKLIRIEVPPVVAINPVILADTVFCPQNTNHLFLGQPAGGQYYINSAIIPSNIFNPTLYPSGNSYRLTYIYAGQACVDSAITGIYLPNSFEIDVMPGNVTGNYCKTSPNDPIYFTLLPPNSNHPIDTASAQFFIGGIQSSTIFSPIQVGPPGDYYVRYVVSDIYGCPEEALDTFTVFPIPNLSISAIAPIYCLNDDTTEIHLYQTSASGVVNELTYSGIGYMQGESVTLTGSSGLVLAGSNPSTPYFYPATAGVGVHGLSYVYTDSNSCMDSINIVVEVLPLPTVLLTTSGGAPLQPYYCENDVVPLFGLPIGTAAQSGYGSDNSNTSHGNPLINTIYPSSLDILNRLFKPNVAGPQPGLLTEYLFYYYEDNNGCRDTAWRPVTIRNFTTDPIITGLPSIICASDLELPVVGNPNGGFDLDSLGWFTSAYTNAFSQLGPVPNTDSIMFYPDSAGIVFAGRNVILTFHYTDTSRNCFNSISDTVWVNALPYLSLSETLVGAGTLADIDPPGSQLIVPATDTFHHICEAALDIPIYAYNTTGLYNSFTGVVSLTSPAHITPDIGIYRKGYQMNEGTQSNFDPVNTAYVYISSLAGPGIDTIRYIYTDSRGCTDSINHIMIVDALPPLSFAGLSNYDAGLGKFVYCETDPNPPLILPSPIGVDWDLTFNGQPITAIPFQLRPDTLAVSGVYMDYPIIYNYVGQIYESGAICADTLSQIIQIRPAPELAWVNVPNSYCILDSLERLPLAATPSGGIFTDITPGLNGIPGIVADTLFDPSAQPGRRDLVYYYMDTLSGCDDTIRHTIYVYNKPRINFDIDGGCSGSQVEFIPTTYPYGLKYNTVAIDSITMVIWNYGDGVIDTIDYLPDTLQIPTTLHTYTGSGIFYPSLTVYNQGICDTTFTRRIVISPTAHPTSTVPYEELFDVSAGGWIQESADTLSVNGIVQDSLWQWGMANGSYINTVADQNNVWATRLNDPQVTYRQGENAWVYSPCFNLTSLERPMIELSIWRNAQNHVDGAVLQYHDNVTNDWKVLGEHGKGINWYQDGFVVSTPGNQTGTPIGWTGDSPEWENARYRLDNIGNDLRNRTNVRFRIAFASSPNTLVGINNGFAFDSVRIGDRTRNVLTEHFSGTGYPGIEAIEDQLYYTIYNNLYGRDVSLIQYHTNRYINNEAFYQFNPVDVNARLYDYGITDVNQVRVDGKDLVLRTSDLLNYPQLEFLDIEALEDPKFKLEFIGTPKVKINCTATQCTLKTIINTTAMQEMNTFGTEEYALHVVVTEDALMTVTNHSTLAVMRAMLPTYAGYPYTNAWAAGDMSSDTTTWYFPPSAHPNPTTRLKVTAFIKNVATKEVYQVISSRDITVFQGPVDTLDVSVDNIEDEPGWEIVNMKLFPNPTQDLFNVSFDKELAYDYEWELVDAVGRTLKTGKVQKGTTQMQVETQNLTSGMYIFVLKNDYIYTQRKVIVHKP